MGQWVDEVPWDLWLHTLWLLLTADAPDDRPPAAPPPAADMPLTELAKMGTVIVPGSERPGQSAVRRHARYPDHLITQHQLYPHVTTIYEAFQNGLSLSAAGPCLGTRAPGGGPYVWQSYKQVDARIQRFGSGLVRLMELLQTPAEEAEAAWRGLLALGREPAEKVSQAATHAARALPPVQDMSRHIGLYAVNRAEWVISEHACSAYSLINVALCNGPGRARALTLRTR